MMSMNEVEQAAAGIGSQIAAGIPLADAAWRMRSIQKKYESFWTATAKGIEDGHPISTFLEGQWPEAIVNAVKAGEMSGKIEEVFEQIEATIIIQNEIKESVYGLAYPAIFGVIGIGVFIYFMVSVIPSLSKSLKMKDKGFVFELSSAMEKYFQNNWIVTAVALAVVVVFVVSWLNNPDNRARMMDLFLGIPVIGDALSHLMWGVWCYYMALIHSSGSIPTPTGLVISSAVLPKSLRPGLLLLAEESTIKGLGAAVDPDKLPTDDPRQQWPYFIHNAFILANDSGNISKELWRVAPPLLKVGKRKLKRAMFVANIVALALVGLLIVGPVMAYYIQLGLALQEAMKG